MFIADGVLGHTQVVRVLLREGIGRDIGCGEGKTPLIYATLGRKRKTASVLITEGANMEAKDNMGEK